jgi:hypothetical protein
MDEELALASAVSDSLNGQGIALVDGEKIVIDFFGKGQLDKEVVESVVSAFVRQRKGHEFYSVERMGDSLVVHSADPIAASRKRATEKLPPNLLKLGDSLLVNPSDSAVSRRRITEKLPPNLFKCPFCSFVTPYEELYVVHTRSHGFK